MAAPQRHGLSPQVLEFVAMESEVEILPNINLDKMASLQGVRFLLSFSLRVRVNRSQHPPDLDHVWTAEACQEGKSAAVACDPPEEEGQVPDHAAALDDTRYRSLIRLRPVMLRRGTAELEATLQAETRNEEFAQLPHDYIEVSKVLLE